MDIGVSKYKEFHVDTYDMYNHDNVYLYMDNSAYIYVHNVYSTGCHHSFAPMMGLAGPVTKTVL